jgi:23S rRNA (adenine2503-C2)-methyltransferase
MIDGKMRGARQENPVGWTPAEWDAWAASLGERPFRGRQAAAWVQRRGVLDPAAMTDLPAPLRESLAGEARPRLPGVVRRSLSADGTAKYLLELEDGERIEMVLIPEGARTTLCFSTQAGCPIGCLFCQTGQSGFRRNLTAAEIAGQVVLAGSLAGEGRRLNSLVVMGMGEPLLNESALGDALEVISGEAGAAIPLRRITLSTAGITPAIPRLRRRFPALNLAVSLNAPDPALRLRLMPGTAPWPLPELLAALRDLPESSRHPVTFEYVLLGGVNDDRESAEGVARVAGEVGARVNLIPWNPAGPGAFEPPTPERVERFRRILAGARVGCYLRRPKGADIEAACGQLRAGGGGA